MNMNHLVSKSHFILYSDFSHQHSAIRDDDFDARKTCKWWIVVDGCIYPDDSASFVDLLWRFNDGCFKK